MRAMDTFRSPHPTERQAVLVAVDVLILFGSVLLALWRRSSWEGTPFSAAYLGGYIEMFGFVALWFIAVAVARGYDLRIASLTGTAVRSLLVAWVLVVGVYFTVFF